MTYNENEIPDDIEAPPSEELPTVERPPLTEEYLARRIFVIRGTKVMLDADLAALYGVPTKAFNQAVRRNPEQFPPDFRFELTGEEYAEMLSGVLQSPRAVQVNIAIMRAFGQLREARTLHAQMLHRIDDLEVRYDGQFARVFDAIRELMRTTVPSEIGSSATRGQISGG